MNVFVLCTGRCGSTTLARACKHISNYTSEHESERGTLAADRLNLPDMHIEVDNRLAWLLGLLEEKYGDDAFYVHLTRDRELTAKSYNTRWEWYGSIVRAYTHGILMRDSDQFEDCLDYVDTVNLNIKNFLKDKTNKMDMSLENMAEEFPEFWEKIGAEGDFEKAIEEIGVKHNPSAKKTREGYQSWYLIEKYDSIFEEMSSLRSDLTDELPALKKKLAQAEKEKEKLAQNNREMSKELKVYRKMKIRKLLKLKLKGLGDS